MTMLSGAIVILAAAIIYAAQIAGQEYLREPDPVALILGLVGLAFFLGGALSLRGDKEKSPKP